MMDARTGSADVVAADGGPEATSMPPTREVAAAALLATVAGSLAFWPFAVAALTSALTSHQPGSVESLLRVPGAAANVPIVAIVGGVAAIGLYRRSPWGRRLALVVATLLLLAPVAAVLHGALVPDYGAWDDATETSVTGGWLDIISIHAFLLPAGQPLLAVVGVLIGGLVALGLLRRPRTAPASDRDGAEAPAAVSAARRPRLAMVLLAVLAVESLAPYLRWLLGAVPVATANGGPVGASGAFDAGAGLLFAIASFGAAGLALVAARSIRSRAALGPYVAPMAATVAGPWSAAWLLVLGLGLLAAYGGQPGEETAALGPLRPVLGAIGAMIAVLGFVALVSPFIVTVAVFRRRQWFRPPGARSPQATGLRPGRFERMAGTLGIVLVAPVLVGTASTIIDPPPPPVPHDGLVFQERIYHHAAPLTGELLPVTPTGILTGWSESLEVADPTALAVPGVPVELAIVVRGTRAGSAWSYGLFLETNACCSIPQELCRYVPIEVEGVFVEPCWPPTTISINGVDYAAIFAEFQPGGLAGGSTFVVRHTDLARSGIPAGTGIASDPRADPEVWLIRDVPPEDAIALTIGSRIVLYSRAERYSAGALCDYSPAAVAGGAAVDPKQMDEELHDQGLEPVPPGCEFPHLVWLDGITFGRDVWPDTVVNALDERVGAFSIPISALTPIGEAEALEPEMQSVDGNPVHIAFPSTIDATAHRIAGVDPARAIAFILGGRVIVVSALDLAEPFPLPPGLCPFLQPAAYEELEASDESSGCPAP